VALAVALRVGLGFLFGLLWVALFQLEGLLRAVVLIGCAAPVGFNALVFSAQHHLDKDFAASITSVSLLLGLFYLPLMLYLLG
jgi:predicted permease